MNEDTAKENEPELDENIIEENANGEQLMVEDTDPLEQLRQDIGNEKDKFLRLFAEFENYKKRNAKERLDLFRTANQEVLQALLPVMDDFDRGLSEIRKAENDELAKGIQLIYDKLRNTLISKGLEEVDINAGDAFNADFAEAITQIPAPSDDMKGKIIDVIEKGYKLGDKIIRFPKVVVGQ